MKSSRRFTGSPVYASTSMSRTASGAGAPERSIATGTTTVAGRSRGSIGDSESAAIVITSGAAASRRSSSRRCQIP